MGDTSIVIDAPPDLDGGYLLSWRVVSSDGHPIGGSVAFSIGEGTIHPSPAGEAADRPLQTAIVAVRILAYLGLFVGIGGVFFAAFISPLSPAGRWTTAASLGIAALAVGVSVGLQGLDALGLTLAAVTEAETWRAGFGTSYGTAALIAGLAILLAALGIGAAGSARRIFAGLGLATLGVAFAATGHASSAPPEWLTRPAVFLHAVGVAIWVGALPPLGILLLGWDQTVSLPALRRFSRFIPWAIVPLVAAGIVLAVIQIGTPSALVDTGYGQVLLAKGALLVFLFILAAVNRLRLTRPALAGDGVSVRRLAASIGAETVLVAVILAVVALWRFTPPPRSLVPEPVVTATVHVHNDKGMAMFTVIPGRVGRVSVSVSLAEMDGAPLAPKEVTLTLAQPDAGIEPVRREMTDIDGAWEVRDILLPTPGAWHVRAAALVTDFDLVTFEGVISIAP
jgi:copper transport protein